MERNSNCQHARGRSVTGKKYRVPLLGIFAFRDQVAIRSPLQMIDFVIQLLGAPGDQGEQMLIQIQI
jgi:hypothetical protein